MSASNKENGNIARVSDILEQIEELNKMIKLHKENSSNSMLSQYEEMKQDFVIELNSILKQFDIDIKAA